MVSRLWTRFSDSDCKRSRPRNGIKFSCTPLPTWNLLLSQRQQFLNNHLAQVPVTTNQQGKHEMRDEVFSSVIAQKGLHTSGYQVSADLDDAEFYWEKDQLDVDAVFRPGIVTPFSPTAFDDLEMGGSAENSILLDEEEDKENSPPTTTTTTTRTTTTPVSQTNMTPWTAEREVVHLEREWKITLIMFLEIGFNRYYRVGLGI